MQALAAFIKEFRAAESAWGVPALAALVRSLRLVAADADASDAAAGRKPERLNDAGGQLMKCFPATYLASVREKRLATLLIVNAAFKIYFKLNTLHLCKNMIASVEARNALSLEEYPVAQRVTYRFYTGRLAVFDENYAKADADLSFALAHCHVAASRNAALILRYLVPVKLLLGQLPTRRLLAAHPELNCYAPVAAAVRVGDVRALNEALEAGQETFIRAGTYLLLEKLKAGVYRTLMKRIHLIQKDREPAKAFQIHISLFQVRLQPAHACCLTDATVTPAR